MRRVLHNPKQESCSPHHLQHHGLRPRGCPSILLHTGTARFRWKPSTRRHITSPQTLAGKELLKKRLLQGTLAEGLRGFAVGLAQSPSSAPRPPATHFPCRGTTTTSFTNSTGRTESWLMVSRMPGRHRAMSTQSLPTFCPRCEFKRFEAMPTCSETCPAFTHVGPLCLVSFLLGLESLLVKRTKRRRSA